MELYLTEKVQLGYNRGERPVVRKRFFHKEQCLILISLALINDQLIVAPWNMKYRRIRIYPSLG